MGITSGKACKADGTPLFLFWVSHIVHGPLQVPDAQLAKFMKIINDTTRAKYHSMVNYKVFNTEYSCDSKRIFDKFERCTIVAEKYPP